MAYSSEDCLDIFEIDLKDTREEEIENYLRDRVICGYRVKTIKSGNMLESEIYPLWNCRTMAGRAKKEKESRKVQKNLNDKYAKKKIIRLINANFTELDIVVNLTYKGKVPDEAEARKDITNYIDRVRYYRKKNGMSELKYLYVIEFENEGTKKKRIHHHIIMSGMDRDVAEKIWNKGYANCKRLQADEFGFEALGRYMTKDPKGTKRWSASRNLKKPLESVADHKITKIQVEKLSKDENLAEKVFEKTYKGYVFNDISVKFSEYVSGAYLYVRMHKDENSIRKRE